jgi:aminopeptidase N
VEAGRAGASRYLPLAEALAADSAVEVWGRQVTNLVRIDRLQADQPGQAAFRRWAARLLRSHLERIGWDAKPEEDPRTSQLRNVLVDTLGRFDDASVIAESKRRFAAYLANPASLHQELRPAILINAGRHADNAEYEQIRAELDKSIVQSDRVLYLRAIQAVQDPALVRRTLALSTAPEFPAGEVASTLSAVAESGGVHATLAWKTLRENFPAVSAKVSPVLRKTIAPNVAIYFSDAASADELEDFVRREVKGVGAENEARKAAAEIRAAAALKSRLLPEVDAWLRRAKE